MAGASDYVRDPARDPADVPRELSRRLRGRVLVVTGSGVSAESGIPTFRGQDGYWRQRDPTELATQAAFDREPELVWAWYAERRARIRQARPNAAHEALARLAAVARECLIVTQNVDDLHERAGTRPEHLVHVHGEIFISRCRACAFSTRADIATEPLPTCPSCRALLRPGVVWFGEALDRRHIARIEHFLARGPLDVALAIGTTATFGYIIDWAVRGGTLVDINPEPTPLSEYARWTYRAGAATIVPWLLSSVASAD